jgi:hypothetical protein
MAPLRKVLEIGYGGFPMANTANGDIRRFARMLPPDTAYHGIDFPGRKDGKAAYLPNSVRNIEIADMEALYCRERNVNVFLYRMDGRSLGFRDGVFDEVHLHDIIHDPRISLDDVRLMLVEAYRVMAESGCLIATGMEGRTFETRIAMSALAMEEARFRRKSGEDLYDYTKFGMQIEKGYGRMPWFTIIAVK